MSLPEILLRSSALLTGGFHSPPVGSSGACDDFKGMNLHGEAYMTFLMFSFLSISFRNILFCIIGLALAMRKLGVGDLNEDVLPSLQIFL